jgi:hypothetical protein
MSEVKATRLSEMVQTPAPYDYETVFDPAGPPVRKKEKARIEHKVPGRIRMKIPSAKTNPAILDIYRDAFSHIPGILKVNTKPETGSIVIHYDLKREAEFHKQFETACDTHDVGKMPNNDIDDLANKIKAEAEFLAERSELARMTVEMCKHADQNLKEWSGNTIDLKIVLAGGLAAYTFFEIGASAATPMWVTLVLFGVNHLAEMQTHPHPAPVPVQRA